MSFIAESLVKEKYPRAEAQYLNEYVSKEYMFEFYKCGFQYIIILGGHSGALL